MSRNEAVTHVQFLSLSKTVHILLINLSETDDRARIAAIGPTELNIVAAIVVITVHSSNVRAGLGFLVLEAAIRHGVGCMDEDEKKKTGANLH